MLGGTGAAAAAAQTPRGDDADVLQTPFGPEETRDPALSEAQAVATALRHPKVADWVGRY